MAGLKMKYFVLKPEGDDEYALASREAMANYAAVIRDTNPKLAKDLEKWVRKESAAVSFPEFDDNRGSR